MLFYLPAPWNGTGDQDECQSNCQWKIAFFVTKPWNVAQTSNIVVINMWKCLRISYEQTQAKCICCIVCSLYFWRIPCSCWKSITSWVVFILQIIIILYLRARCPSIFSSIAIELNVPRDAFSSIAIELTFVILGHGFKKSRFSPLWYLCAWDKDFSSPLTSLDICIPRWCYCCVIFIIGESPRVCSKYI